VLSWDSSWEDDDDDSKVIRFSVSESLPDMLEMSFEKSLKIVGIILTFLID